MRISLVAAVARGGVIGRDGAIPWRLPEDMVRFRAVTIGHPVVMGRKTWESLPDRFRPLPERRNIVVTRNPEWQGEGAERVASLEEALERLDGENQVYVIGGAQIYTAALPLADELLLTEIELDAPGDTFFPSFDRDAFIEVGREERRSDDGTAFAFVDYARRAVT